MVSVTYDSSMVSADDLANIITLMNYEVAQVAVDDVPEVVSEAYAAPLPADAPEAFAKQFSAARAASQPIVIDFWATWCAPCVRLKHETLEDSKVAAALANVEVIFVDLDQHPELASAYGVESIPDLFFIDRNGMVVDRLREFEEAGPFLERLARFLPVPQSASLGVVTSVPPAAVVSAMGLVDNVRIHGRLIETIVAGGPAAKSGLVAGDVLLSLDGNDLYSADDIADLLAVSKPGSSVEVEYKRGGETETRRATLTFGSHSNPGGGTALSWSYAGLGQLDRAREEARAKKKKIMVGLSGAET